jgi:hypothetical protein
MAHYAFINSANRVTAVIVGRDETDLVEGVESWETYYGNVRGETCLQASCDTYGGVHYTTDEDGTRVPSADQSEALRFNYAGVGFSYDKARDAFIPPTLFPSWVLNEATCQWVAPTPKPDGDYVWDEQAGEWVEA